MSLNVRQIWLMFESAMLSRDTTWTGEAKERDASFLSLFEGHAFALRPHPAVTRSTITALLLVAVSFASVNVVGCRKDVPTAIEMRDASPPTAAQPSAARAGDAASLMTGHASLPDTMADAGKLDAAARPASARYSVDKFDFLTSGDGLELWEKSGQSWIDARVDAAKKTTPELVRAPLMHRGEWGCMCPEYYFGVMSVGNTANRWIEPDFAPTAPEPEREVRPRKEFPGTVEVPGLVMIAEGYFTGESIERRFNPDGKPDTLHRFRVLRIRPPRGEADAKPVVVRSTVPYMVGERDAGGSAASRPTIDKPFLVIHESFPTEAKDSKDKADRLVAVLRGKGFADAEAFDATSVPGLFCCYWAVTLGRYSSEAEAGRVAADAQKRHVIAAVRRGY